MWLKIFIFYENEGLAPFAGTFLRFSGLQYLFFSLGNYPYLHCALFHANTLTHNRIFYHKGIDVLISRFNSFCDLIDNWIKENVLLDGSLTSCFIYQDVSLEIWHYLLKLCMIHSLKETGKIRLFSISHFDIAWWSVTWVCDFYFKVETWK